jgi:16S rRNA pseudouridine516 synthase
MVVFLSFDILLPKIFFYFSTTTTMATPTIRLDKYLSELSIVPRRQVVPVIKAGMVLVDGVEATKADMKVAYGQVLTYFGAMPDGTMHEDGVAIEVKERVYVLLHKSAGYVCSELDEGGHLSYKNLLEGCPYAAALHVAGRLDQDTEGLVLCSNDGVWTHQIISPKKQLEKEYFLRTQAAVRAKDIAALEEGVEFLP